jgi:hypothetical protein
MEVPFHMSTKMRLALTAAVAALCLTSVSPALAGKGGRPKPSGGTGTISLVLLNSTDGLAHYGQKLTYKVSPTASSEPRVGLQC